MSQITEMHGWISLRFTYESTNTADDEDARRLAGIVAAVEQKTKSLGFTDHADVRSVDVGYGEAHVSLTGFSWHRSDYLSAVQLFQFVAETAPGSYGMLYLVDHDSGRATVTVLRRGVLTEHQDPWFTPLIPTVEDGS